MDKLEIICLDKICDNLLLIKKICERRNYKIPSKLGQKIFDNSFRIINEFTEEDLKFFRKEIIEIKSVNFYKKQFKTIEYFDFLNEQHLENLIIGNIENFRLRNNVFLLTVNNLQIGDYSYSKPINFDGLEILLLNVQVKNSITFKANNKIAFSNVIYYLLKNSKHSLTSINIPAVDLTLYDFKSVLCFLKGQKQLKELSLNLKDIFQNNIHMEDKFLLGYLKNLPNTITELNLNLQSNDYQLFNCLSIIFKQLNKLDSFSLDTFIDDDDLIIEILNNIKQFSSDKLIYIDFTFVRITKLVNQKLIEFFYKCSNLTSIYISCINEENNLDQYFVFSCCHLAQEIKHFYPEFSNNDSISYSYNKFLTMCKSLKSVEIGFYLDIRVQLKNIFSALKSSRESLTSIEFSFCTITNEFALGFPSLVYCLEVIEFEVVNFQGNSLAELLKNLRHTAENLKKFIFIGCELESTDCVVIGRFLGLCRNLEEINLSYNELVKNGILMIIDNLSFSKDSLKIIDFSCCGLEEDEAIILNDFLLSLRNLEIFRAGFNIIPPLHLFNMLKSLKN